MTSGFAIGAGENTPGNRSRMQYATMKVAKVGSSTITCAECAMTGSGAHKGELYATNAQKKALVGRTGVLLRLFVRSAVKCSEDRKQTQEVESNFAA